MIAGGHSIFKRLGIQDVLRREARKKEIERQFQRELKDLQNSSKSSPHSKRLYKQRLRRNLRIALDLVQPHAKGAQILPTHLICKCIKCLGVLQHVHKSSEFKPETIDLKERYDKALSHHAKNDEVYREETVLAQEMKEWLDKDNQGFIEVDKLYKRLCWVIHCPNEFSKLKKRPVLPETLKGHILNTTLKEHSFLDAEKSFATSKRLKKVAQTVRFLLFNHITKREGLCDITTKPALTSHYRTKLSCTSLELARKARIRLLKQLNIEMLNAKTLPDYLRAKAAETEKLLEEKRKEKIEEEIKQCTFYPKTLASLKLRRKSPMAFQNSADVIPFCAKMELQAFCPPFKETFREKHYQRMTRNHYLFYQGMQQAQINKAIMEEIRVLKEKRELRECTFGPKILHRSLSNPRHERPLKTILNPARSTNSKETKSIPNEKFLRTIPAGGTQKVKLVVGKQDTPSEKKDEERHIAQLVPRAFERSHSNKTKL